jgi:hypothetical protein
MGMASPKLTATSPSHSLSRKKGPRAARPETIAKKAAFLAAYRQMGVVSYAAKVAGIARETAHRWRREDEAFAEQFAKAHADATDNLEGEALRRAVEGVERPVIHRRQVVMAWTDGRGNYVPEGAPHAVREVPVTIREYSDTLLIFLLKAARPEKYRERRHSTVEPPSPRSPVDRSPARLPMDDPTIRRLTGEVFAILETKKDPCDGGIRPL